MSEKLGRWIWRIALTFVVLLATAQISAWAVWHASQRNPAHAELNEVVMQFGKFPHTAKRAMVELGSIFSEDPLPQLLDRATVEKEHWQRSFPSPQDDGYLLLAGTDPEFKQSAVRLLKISTGETLASWAPDWAYVASQMEELSATSLMAFHPVLEADGSIVFVTGDSMMRLDYCQTQPRWLTPETAHHSVERAQSGGYWTGGISKAPFSENQTLNSLVRDDSLLHVAEDGTILQNISFSKALIDNDLTALLVGSMGYHFNEDPVHINQISEAPTTTDYWQKGDLLISARHLSSVFLYRPATGAIVWHKQGPWLNQHSAQFVDDHRIGIFDNNILSAIQSDPFLTPDDVNRVMVYDFATDTVSEPYAALLAEAKPVSFSEGRVEFLADGGIFVEESNFGRHLRFSADALLWSRVNDYDETRIGVVSWARYLTQEVVTASLQSIAAVDCAPAN